MCLYISPPLEETKGRTGGGLVSSKNAGLRRSMEVHSCFRGCRGGMPLVVAGGPCMGQCKVRRVADDDNPCG